MKDVATAFPLSRTLDVKNADKTTRGETLRHQRQQLRHHQSELRAGAHRSQEGQEGPLTWRAAGTYNGADKGRFVVVGTSQWAGNNFIRFNGNRDLFLNMINWLSSDEDLISIRPKAPEDRPLNMSARRS